MNSNFFTKRKINIVLISTSMAFIVLIAASLISLTTQNDTVWAQNTVDDTIRLSQGITEHSVGVDSVTGQTSAEMQNSLGYLDEHIKKSQERLDEHIQSSKGRFDNWIGKE